LHCFRKEKVSSLFSSLESNISTRLDIVLTSYCWTIRTKQLLWTR